MANGHGGKRPGAGRKRKALSEKLLDGNPGKGPLTKLDFGMKETDMHGEDMPPVSEYLKQVTKNSNQNLAPQIYEDTWHWLNDSLARKDEKLDHSHGRFEPTHGNYTILERKNTIFHRKTRCLG